MRTRSAWMLSLSATLLPLTSVGLAHAQQRGNVGQQIERLIDAGGARLCGQCEQGDSRLARKGAKDVAEHLTVAVVPTAGDTDSVEENRFCRRPSRASVSVILVSSVTSNNPQACHPGRSADARRAGTQR